MAKLIFLKLESSFEKFGDTLEDKYQFLISAEELTGCLS